MPAGPCPAAPGVAVAIPDECVSLSISLLATTAMILLGHWHWANETDALAPPGWNPPATCVGAIDLASAAQIAAAKPGEPRGVGLFVCWGVPAGWDGAVLAGGDLRDERPDAKMLSAWKSLTGYQPAGDTLAECLWDHLTNGADPANRDSCGVLMPDATGQSNLWLGGKIAGRRFQIDEATGYAAKVRNVLKAELAVAKAQSLAGKMLSPKTGQPDLRYYLKIADALAEKFAGKNHAKKAAILEAIRPASFDKDDILVPHETTLTETWTHDDTNDGGNISADQTWASVLGLLEIGSNAVRVYDKDVCHARCEADLSSSDHSCQLEQSLTVATVTARNWAPTVRYSSSANTCYHGKQFAGSSGTGIRRIAKNITGTMTNLGTGTSGNAQNATCKISCDGSSIKIYSAGTLLETITDTSITSGTRCGIFLQGWHADWIVDNWQAEDLGGGGGIIPTPYYRLMAGMGNL
jgi:hypothetical protein